MFTTFTWGLAATCVIVAAAGLSLVSPAGIAHADPCGGGFDNSIQFGPDGCLNPAWRTSPDDRGDGGGAGSADAPTDAEHNWPPSG